MERDFLKMHALGNDFVIVDGRKNAFAPGPDLCRWMSDRRRGIGFDQLAVLENPHTGQADIFIRLFNADGSPTGACGNATRCVAKLVLAEKKVETAVVETASGLLPVAREGSNGFSVDFGAPRLGWQDIPLAQGLDTNYPGVDLQGLGEPAFVSMGNPHAVFFVPDAEAVDLATLGPLLEYDPLFPERANIEVAQVLAPDRIRMRVWERGTGITPACGTGACATLVAAARRGLTDRRATIVLDGGDLIVDWRVEDHLRLIGGATVSYLGKFDDAVLG